MSRPKDVNDNEKMISDEISIDETVLNRMITKVYKLEKDNSQTKVRSNTKMKEEIRNIIEEEAEKCY